MQTVSIRIDVKQIENVIKQMNINEKLKLFNELEKETRRERWNELVSKIRERYKKNPISDKEINRTCEEVRQQMYEKTAKSCY